MVARFKPVHLGHAGILRTACALAAEFLIGIGSSDIYDYRNPFTLEETEDMIRLTLGNFSNYRFIPVPDLNNGPKWRDMVTSLFGSLDYFISANDYVRSLLAGVYRLVHPLDFIDEADRTPLTGTAVRTAMAKGENWRAMVPETVADYLVQNRLEDRFCAEFGLKTLGDLA